MKGARGRLCYIMLWDGLLTDWLSAGIETRVKTNAAVELRDSLEQLCAGQNYPVFLSKLWPVFKKILKGEPVFISMSWEQVRRSMGQSEMEWNNC